MVVTGGLHYHYLGYFIDNKPHSCFNAFSRVDVRVDVKIPGGVNAYIVDLRGERYVGFDSQQNNLSYAILDMKLHPKFGKKPTCRHSFAQFCTLMIRPTGWTRTVSSIQSLRQRAKCASYKLRRPCL